MRTVIGVFDEMMHARAAVQDLVNAGIPRDDISLIASDPNKEYATTLGEEVDDAAEGALEGAVAGGLLGGLAGALLGLSAFVIPGLGPIIAAGPVAAALIGAGVGAAGGGLVGALIGWGLSEEEAGYYAEAIRRGSTLVAVRVDEDQVDTAVEVLNRHNPVDVDRQADFWRTEESWIGYDPNTPAYTRDEVQDYRNRYYNYAGIGMAEDIYEDYSVYEPGFRRHYDIAYAAAGYPYSQYDPAYRYGYSLATDARYRDYTDWETLEPMARRDWEDMAQGAWEDFKDAIRHAWNETKQAVRETFDTDYDYAEYEDDFRRHYDTVYGVYDYTYTRYEPAYRYGYLLATDERYADYDDWETLEPIAHRDWDDAYDGPWEDFKEAVRHAWNRVTGATERAWDEATDTFDDRP
ncbi:MAG: hypothetical protein L0332_30685 [Chloroflexi bacterium]|nr:hypothetical protein [Chloroflexota bacterium]MCI0577356.1 hypothetical protein [Chloroflexota bacterium]MCI0647043.1 hypothetical protein [Chloroflexota bacterium]MCI0731066.1 hypothetical protein [Chloroflexota bacterium]